jgi:hypothetical protein
MSRKHIISTLAVASAAVATGVPASYGGQPPLSVAVHLEAHANADTAAAQRVAHRSGGRARKLMARGARELARAAAIVAHADAQASASGSGADDEAVLTAQASLSSAAADQSATLTAIADAASGKVEAAAKRAQARAEAIRSRADAALEGPGDDSGVVSVSVSADAGTGDDSASDEDASDSGATGGIELLGVLSGGGR